MKISFADAQKLLISAKENNCVILMDGTPVDISCHDRFISLYTNLDYPEDDHFECFRSSVNIDVDAIVIKDSISTRKIQIYKKPMTKEEYLTTLEFLKND